MLLKKSNDLMYYKSYRVTAYSQNKYWRLEIVTGDIMKNIVFVCVMED